MEQISETRFLGPLCPQNHVYENSGCSLLNKNGKCVECLRLTKRKVLDKQKSMPPSFYAGFLCKDNHIHFDQLFCSLRNAKRGECVECFLDRQREAHVRNNPDYSPGPWKLRRFLPFHEGPPCPRGHEYQGAGIYDCLDICIQCPAAVRKAQFDLRVKSVRWGSLCSRKHDVFSGYSMRDKNGHCVQCLWIDSFVNFADRIDTLRIPQSFTLGNLCMARHDHGLRRSLKVAGDCIECDMRLSNLWILYHVPLSLGLPCALHSFSLRSAAGECIECVAQKELVLKNAPKVNVRKQQREANRRMEAIADLIPAYLYDLKTQCRTLAAGRHFLGPPCDQNHITAHGTSVYLSEGSCALCPEDYSYYSHFMPGVQYGPLCKNDHPSLPGLSIADADGNCIQCMKESSWKYSDEIYSAGPLCFKGHAGGPGYSLRNRDGFCIWCINASWLPYPGPVSLLDVSTMNSVLKHIRKKIIRHTTRYIGRPCKNGHSAISSGLAIKSMSGRCCECDRESGRIARVKNLASAPYWGVPCHKRGEHSMGGKTMYTRDHQCQKCVKEYFSRRKTQLAKISPYEGSLCKRKHDNGSGRSWRNSNGVCVECAKEKVKILSASPVFRLRKRFREALRRYSLQGKVKPSREYGINYEVIAKWLGPCPGDPTDYEIDHVIPLALFDLNDPEQIKLAFMPENHQWLLAELNSAKKNSLIPIDGLPSALRHAWFVADANLRARNKSHLKISHSYYQHFPT